MHQFRAVGPQGEHERDGAEVHPGLAVVKPPPGYRGFALLHIKSGKGLNVFEHPEQASHAASLIAPLLDWTGNEDCMLKTTPDVRSHVRSILRSAGGKW